LDIGYTGADTDDDVGAISDESDATAELEVVFVDSVILARDELEPVLDTMLLDEVVFDTPVRVDGDTELVLLLIVMLDVVLYPLVLALAWAATEPVPDALVTVVLLDDFPDGAATRPPLKPDAITMDVVSEEDTLLVVPAELCATEEDAAVDELVEDVTTLLATCEELSEIDALDDETDEEADDAADEEPDDDTAVRVPVRVPV
jgi:hypothetical protein